METQVITKTYVRFYYPGILFAEEGRAIEVQTREIDQLDIPDNAHGFIFFDIAEATINGKIMTADRENISPTYWIGDIYSLEEIREMNQKEPNSYKILLQNMECNKYDRIVATRGGNWYPLNDTDYVI